MKRGIVLVVLCAGVGVFAGNTLRPGNLTRLANDEHTMMADGRVDQQEPVIARSIGENTVLIAVNELYLAEDNIDPAILAARMLGEQARQRAIDETLYGPTPKDGEWKDGGWAAGGPYIELDPARYVVTPSRRPADGVQLAAVPAFPGQRGINPTPILPFTPPATGGFFSPGDPRAPVHRRFVETLEPPIPPGLPEPVPAPASWMLMILGFAALAMRQRAAKRAIKW